MIQEHDCEYKCQVCQSPSKWMWACIGIFYVNTRWTKLKYFTRIFPNTTVMAGLAKYLMETKEAPLELFLTRTHIIYDDLKALFPVERKIYENALLTGDGRIIDFLKSVRWFLKRMHLPWSFFNFAWQNDWMELITDLYEIKVFTGTSKSPMALLHIRGNYELMDRLIAHGANIDFWNLNTSPLYCACISKKYDNTEERSNLLDKYWENLKVKLKASTVKEMTKKMYLNTQFRIMTLNSQFLISKTWNQAVTR